MRAGISDEEGAVPLKKWHVGHTVSCGRSRGAFVRRLSKCEDQAMNRRMNKLVTGTKGWGGLNGRCDWLIGLADAALAIVICAT